jgi:hypothetical protein
LGDEHDGFAALTGVSSAGGFRRSPAAPILESDNRLTDNTPKTRAM